MLMCWDVFDEDNFEESDHPRDGGGKFSKGGGGGGGKKSFGSLRAEQEYHFSSKSGSTIHYESGNKKISFNGSTNEWSAHVGGEKVASGTGKKSIVDYLKNGEVTKAEAKPATSAKTEKKSAAPAKAKENTSGAGTIVESHGYSLTSLKDDDIIAEYTKGDKTIQVNQQTGEWLSKSPGNMTKKGMGAENLDILLSGVSPTGKVGKWGYTHQTSLGSSKTSSSEAKQHGSTETMQKLIAAAPSASSSQSKAIKSYCGPSYHTINGELRGHPPKTTAQVEHIDAWLNKATFPEDVTLYRKVGAAYASVLRGSLIEGSKFIDHGYSSTSTHEGAWHGDLKFVITAKKGQKGGAVKHISPSPHENEVLLPRDTIYIVDKIDKTNSVVHLRIGG